MLHTPETTKGGPKNGRLVDDLHFPFRGDVHSVTQVLCGIHGCAQMSVNSQEVAKKRLTISSIVEAGL